MAAEVFLLPLPDDPSAAFLTPDLRGGLRRMIAALGLKGAAAAAPGWGLKVHVGAPGGPAGIAPEWARAIAEALGGGAQEGAVRRGTFAADTLSITTRGLDSPAALRDAARLRGYGLAGDPLPFVVADDPEVGGETVVPSAFGSELHGHAVAGALIGLDGLCVLNPLRPHPHFGAVGAVAALGMDLAGREAKLRLHLGIRPQVDTPLCAGCGSCLDVCLYDAIVIRAGRAHIDHKACTGCGECMGVCFMAGIAPEDAGGVPVFQAAVAEAAASTVRIATKAGPRRQGYFNFMLQLGRYATASRARRRLPLADIGVLASSDPVALDACSFQMLEARLGGPISQWSGFGHEPQVLLERAEALGLGTREFRLTEL